MPRTTAEVKHIGNNMVNTIVAEMLAQFPRLRAAIDKLPRQEWSAFVDELCYAAGENLVSQFGATDR